MPTILYRRVCGNHPRPIGGDGNVSELRRVEVPADVRTAWDVILALRTAEDAGEETRLRRTDTFGEPGGLVRDLTEPAINCVYWLEDGPAV